MFFFLMTRRPQRSTRTDTLSLHDALPICEGPGDRQGRGTRAQGGCASGAAADAAGAGRPLPWRRPPRMPDYRADVRRRRLLHQIAPGAVFAESAGDPPLVDQQRSEEHTSELQSLMRTSYAVFCLKKKKT